MFDILTYLKNPHTKIALAVCLALVVVVAASGFLLPFSGIVFVRHGSGIFQEYVPWLLLLLVATPICSYGFLLLGHKLLFDFSAVFRHATFKRLSDKAPRKIAFVSLKELIPVLQKDTLKIESWILKFVIPTFGLDVFLFLLLAAVFAFGGTEMGLVVGVYVLLIAISFLIYTRNLGPKYLIKDRLYVGLEQHTNFVLQHLRDLWVLYGIEAYSKAVTQFFCRKSIATEREISLRTLYAKLLYWMIVVGLIFSQWGLNSDAEIFPFAFVGIYIAAQFFMEIFNLVGQIWSFQSASLRYELLLGQYPQTNLEEPQEARMQSRESQVENQGYLIEISNMSLFREGRQLAEAINLHLKTAETLLITGESGSGKTSFLEALAGINPDFSGSLRLNHKALGIESSKEAFTYLDRDHFLFHGSLLENLRLYQPNLQEEEIAELMAVFQLEDWYKNLPGLHHTPINQSQAPLSGGQLSRLFLLCNYIHPGKIKLIDEPTLHLDFNTAQEVCGVLNRLFAKAPKIIVAHHFYQSLDYQEHVEFV